VDILEHRLHSAVHNFQLHARACLFSCFFVLCL